MTHEAMVQEVIDVIWNKGQVERVRDYYSDDFISHQPEHGVVWNPGPEGVQEIVTRTRGHFPDYHEEIQDVIASGDRVVLRLKNTGTYAGKGPMAGKSFEVADFMAVRIEDGKIAEQWGLFDLYSFHVQLGRIKPL